MHPKSLTLLDVHIFLWVKQEEKSKFIVRILRYLL